MISKTIIAAFITLHFCINCQSQAIDYTAAFRAIGKDKSFRFSYENDFFSASDRDYTQGVYIEFIHPSLKKIAFPKFLWRQKLKQQLYGLALETDGYTPNQIEKEAIQFSDRPYASTLLLRFFNTSLDQGTGKRLTRTLTIGVLGPKAGGKEIQSSIHRWIGYTKPLGWHNQIHNEPVINYQMNYEKVLLGDNRHFLLTGQGIARAGTLSTKAGIGFSIMAGNFDNPFSIANRNTGKFKVHFYDQPLINLIGYDATLQGGIFNRHSPYIIQTGQLNRLVFQNRYGLVLSFRRIMLEYWQSFLTREFNSGIEPKTGGIQMAVKL